MDKLSILIPIYNFDCSKLINDLHKQCDECGVAYEIVCMDDASSSFVDENESVKQLINVDFIRLDKNVGRSKIRNLLADKASGDYLLFLDCDSKIGDGFIDTYLRNVGDIVAGGHIYDVKPEDDRYYLHWKYGSKMEPKPMDRERHFTTVNFMIRKELFDKVRFDENIKGYGHEDTVFGLALRDIGFNINYICNPVYHIGLNTNDKFLNNTKNAVGNLRNMMKDGMEERYLKEIKIYRYYKFINAIGIKPVFSFTYRLFKPIMERHLLGKEPSMFVLNVYKICYMCSLK